MKPQETHFIRSAGVISVLTFCSRVLGLIRESVFAYYFGASAVWDAFTIAFRIPNLSRRLFGEGALSAAFIPVLSEKLHHHSPEAAQRLAGGVLALLMAILSGLVLIGEGLIALLYNTKPDLTLALTAIMLPYSIFICAVALMSGAHNVIGRFGVPAFLPILFNVILIVAAAMGSLGWISSEEQHTYVLAWTIVISGVLQFVLQYGALVRSGFKPLLNWEPYNSDIRNILITLGPMVLGLSAVQINTLADVIIAKIFIEQGGGAAALSYGERLYQFPLGLFGASIATAIYPQLARLSQAKDDHRFSQTLTQGLRLGLLIGIPASAGLYWVRTPLVQLAFERGQFDASATARVAEVVGWFGLGIWAFILQQILVRGYYALRDSQTPMRIAVYVVLLNLVLNLILVQYMDEAGIALATTLCAVLQVFLLAYRLSKVKSGLAIGSVFSSSWRMLLATLAMCGAIQVAELTLIQHLPRLSFFPFLSLFIQVGVGVICYWVACKGLKIPEIHQLRGSALATSANSDSP